MQTDSAWAEFQGRFRLLDHRWCAEDIQSSVLMTTRRRNRTAISPSGGARTIHYAMRARARFVVARDSTTKPPHATTFYVIQLHFSSTPSRCFSTLKPNRIDSSDLRLAVLIDYGILIDDFGRINDRLNER